MWLSEALQLSNGHAHALATHLGSSLHTMAECLAHGMHLLSRSSGGGAANATASEGVLLAAGAAEALLALTHIAMNQPRVGGPDLVPTLRECAAAKLLREQCMRIVTDTAVVEAAAAAPRLRTDVWTCLMDVHVVWLTHAKDVKEAQWELAAHELADAIAPVAQLWARLQSALCDVTVASDVWDEATALIEAACGAASTMCNTVGRLSRAARRCTYSSIRPMLTAALALLRAANARGVEAAAVPLGELLATVAANMLSEMSKETLAEVFAASREQPTRACPAHSVSVSKCMCECAPVWLCL